MLAARVTAAAHNSHNVRAHVNPHTVEMIKAVFAFLFLGVVAATEVACHPQCKWLCDDPVCPAKCHPVCARPKCQMDCKQSECAKCEVHCEEPVCSVRCPKQMCELEGCPSCETVCRPAVCRTTCTAPEPNCSPLCEKTKCAWKCKTPTLCPKPKCQLTCEQPGCTEDNVFGGASGGSPCCPCNAGGVSFAMLHADVHHKNSTEAGSQEGDEVDEAKLSLIEALHSMSAKEQNGESQCCPCAAP